MQTQQQSIADRINEADYYVSYRRDKLAELNYLRLVRMSRFISVVFISMLAMFWLFFSGFELIATDVLPPVIMFGYSMLLERRCDAYAKDFDKVRRLTLIFYMFAVFVLCVFDLRIHTHSAVVFFPVSLIVLPAVYIDSLWVYSGFLSSFIFIYLVTALVMHRPPLLTLEDIVLALACAITSVYCYFMMLSHLTEESRGERALKEEGQVDLLTGLLNKVSFERKTEKYLSVRGDAKCALLIIDFDNFKSVNDENGHLVGDAILKKFGRILKKNFRESDIVGRVGGDEFMVLMTGTVPIEVIDRHCSDVQHELYISRVGEAGGFSCSIGVVLDNAGFDFKNMYRLADDALYEAKARGKAQHIIWQSQRVIKPEKNIIYLASPDMSVRDRIRNVMGSDYIYMEASVASKALNEISLYQEYLESVFFDYNMPDMEERVLRRYINSRPIFSQIPVHDVKKEL